MNFLMKSAIALSLLSSTAIAAQAAPTFSPDRLKADVTFLADDLLEGRQTGTRGYDIAANFVAQRFASLGLQQAIGGSWYQPVAFQENKLVAPGATVAIGGKVFRNLGDVIVYPDLFEKRRSVTAPVVFAGYGLSAPERGIDDYAGLDVRGKYVAVLSGFPKGMAGDIGAHLANEKTKFAQDHGAVGVIAIVTPRSLKTASWERRKEYAASPTMEWIDDNGRPYSDSPDVKAGATLHGPAQRALFAGAPRSLDDIIAASENEGSPKGFALKPTVTVKRASEHRRLDSNNVIALLPGADPVLRNEYVVVMGHLDHIGVDTSLKGDQINNGAMDNAAGIATMLETARAMTEGPRSKRSILFVAVTGEEEGLLGAAYLAKHPAVPAGGKVVGVVNLDMPLLTYDFTDIIAFGAEQSTLGKVVEVAAAKDGVKVSPDPQPDQNLFTRSDHYNFVKAGIPSVFLGTGHAGAGKAAWEDFLAHHYHRPSDDLTRPVNWQAAAKFARINYLIAQEIANAPDAPRWYSDSFFGTIFAKDAPKAPR